MLNRPGERFSKLSKAFCYIKKKLFLSAPSSFAKVWLFINFKWKNLKYVGLFCTKTPKERKTMDDRNTFRARKCERVPSCSKPRSQNESTCDIFKWKITFCFQHSFSQEICEDQVTCWARCYSVGHVWVLLIIDVAGLVHFYSSNKLQHLTLFVEQQIWTTEYSIVQLKSSRRYNCYHGVALATTQSTSAAKPLLPSVNLFACSLETFNNLAIFIQGSRLYGRLDFAAWVTPSLFLKGDV